MMDKFRRIPSGLDDVSLIEPVVFRDDRGFFLESYNKQEFERIGIRSEYIQDNHSASGKGVIRGLHFQKKYPQEKLVRVVKGSIFDVVVDLRNGSPGFGTSIGVILSAADMKMIHIPVGFAHGFLALEQDTQVIYKTSEFYYPEYDAGILWNDPQLGIHWPLKEYGIEKPVISEKDRLLPKLGEIEQPFIFGEDLP
jgi:dTDP-4-dehydrorhamnose 3,5-epimerase